MCHLCTKISKLGSKASTKPLFTILHKLYKRVEPHLGDYWLWRLERTQKLRRLLVKLGADALVEDIDAEIGFIRKEMVGHPLQLREGRVERLIGGKRQESEDREIRREIKAKRREASVRKVEEWLKDWEVAIVDDGDDSDEESSQLSEDDFLSETSSATTSSETLSSSSLDSSRSSKTNMGSLLNWKHGSDDESAAGSDDSPLIPVIPEFAQLVRKEPGGVVSHYPQTRMVLGEDWARDGGSGDEGGAKARRRRRAERNGMVLGSGAEKFREDERRKFWVASR